MVGSGGSTGAPQNVLNFMQFFGKFGKIMLVPPGGLAAPPTGNPESAPGGRGTLKEKRQCEI